MPPRHEAPRAETQEAQYQDLMRRYQEALLQITDIHAQGSAAIAAQYAAGINNWLKTLSHSSEHLSLLCKLLALPYLETLIVPRQALADL